MRATILTLTVVLSTPAPAAAWGFDVHRHIVDRAIDLLPPAMRSFYQTNRRFVVEHTIDPDLWRLVGFEEERPRHFLNLDAIGTYPFTDLPREYDRAVERFGLDVLQRHGTLPWRAQEIHGLLQRAFEEQKKGSRWALGNAQFFSAVVAHYVADAHVPFHAVSNYDGQLTKQRGIHERFETDLFSRFRQELRIKPAPIRPRSDVRDFMFETLLESFEQAEPALQADLEARRGVGRLRQRLLPPVLHGGPTRARTPIVERHHCCRFRLAKRMGSRRQPCHLRRALTSSGVLSLCYRQMRWRCTSFPSANVATSSTVKWRTTARRTSRRMRRSLNVWASSRGSFRGFGND